MGIVESTLQVLAKFYNGDETQTRLVQELLQKFAELQIRGLIDPDSFEKPKQMTHHDPNKNMHRVYPTWYTHSVSSLKETTVRDIMDLLEGKYWISDDDINKAIGQLHRWEQDQWRLKPASVRNFSDVRCAYLFSQHIEGVPLSEFSESSGDINSLISTFNEVLAKQEVEVKMTIRIRDLKDGKIARIEYA